MLKYIFNSNKFNELVKEKGYKSLSQFAQVTEIHRNTLRDYLIGKKEVFPHFLTEVAETLEVDPLTLVHRNNDISSSYAHYEIIDRIEQLCIEHKEVAFILLGSRAKGTARMYSDWDIGITRGHLGNNTSTYLKVKSALQDMFNDFAYSVDVVNLDAAPQWFINEISYTPIFLCGNMNSYNYFLGILDGIKRKKQIQ